MNLVTEFIYSAPELVLLLCALSLLMIGVFKRDQTSSKTLTYGALGSLLGAVGLVFILGGTESLSLNEMFLTNSFTQFCKGLILVSSAAVLYMSLPHLDREGLGAFEYPVVILFGVLGMMMMVSANDLLSLFMGVELQSLSLYILVAFNRERLLASEAGLKYFILGALSTVFVLYGISLIYGFTGTTEFSGIFMVLRGSDELSLMVLSGLLFLFSGMAFKVSLVPFHMWTPDVYEGSPTPVTAFLTAAPKVAAFALLIRLALEVFPFYAVVWQTGLMIFCFASMTLGALAALFQKNLKRLLAYSSIGHMGYALLGLLGGTVYGLESLLVYLGLYVVMAVGAFACLLCLKRQGQFVEDIDDLAGLSKESPGVAFSLGILLFSLAGLPPLGGFFAKLGVFIAAVESGFYILATLGVLTSVVGAAYYLKIIRRMYFDRALETDRGLKIDAIPSRESAGIMWASVLIIVFYILYPDLLILPARTAAQAIFPGP